MANDSTRLVSNIKYYTIGVFSTRLLAFLFIPLYSIYINPDSLGQFQYINSLLMLIVPVLYQSIWEGMFRYSIVSNGEEQKVINTTTQYCLGLSVIYTVIFFIAAFVLKIENPIYILLCGISQMAVSYWQFAARALKKNKAYSVSTVVCSAVTIFLNIILIVVFKWQIDALFISCIAGSLASVIVLEYRLKLIKKSKQAAFEKKLLFTIIKYSLPLAVNSVSWWLISSCNNIVVTKALGESANGILAMAQRFGSIFALMTSIIAMAWQEESFRNLYNGDKNAYFNKVLNLYTKAIFSIVCVLIPITYLLYQFMVFGEYTAGVALTSLLYIIGAFNAIITHIGSEFLARGESDVMFWTTLVTGVLTVIFSILFVKPFGLIGVMVVTIFSCIVNFIIRVILLRKRIVLNFDYIQLTVLFTVSIVVSYICDFIGYNAILQLATFCVIGSFAAVYNRNLLKNIVRRVLNK